MTFEFQVQRQSSADFTIHADNFDAAKKKLSALLNSSESDDAAWGVDEDTVLAPTNEKDEYDNDSPDWNEISID